MFNFNWLANISNNLDSLGLGYIHVSTPPLPPQQIIRTVKLRLADSNLQDWEHEIMVNPLCRNYRMFKSAPELAPYLTVLPINLRITLCRFRTRCHNLPVCAQRFNKNAPQSKLRCPLCNSNDVGDEFHYVFICSAFSTERRKFIPNRLSKFPNSIKFHELFNSSDPKILLNLARFVAIVTESFKYVKEESPIKLRASHTTRAGRLSKPPVRLQVNFAD